MKEWMLIPILILLIILLSCQKQNKEELSSLEKPQEQEKEEIFPVAQEVEKKLVGAIENLQKGKVADGAGLLLEATLMVKPGEYWPDEFENTILLAKEQFQNGNLKKGIDLSSEALLLINPLADMPDEEVKEEPMEAEQAQKKDEPSPVAEIFRDKILLAKEEFKKGNAENGVILILEAFQLLSPRSEWPYEKGSATERS
jgi:radical SAM superfamily enzyme YgiQ (UPF0313 family)